MFYYLYGTRFFNDDNNDNNNNNNNNNNNTLSWRKNLASLLTTSTRWHLFSTFQCFGSMKCTTCLASEYLYSLQRKGVSINTTSQENEQFTGLQMYMSIIDFPTYWRYWENDTRYPLIANMLRNRYQKLRELLHINDISKKDNPQNARNKYIKYSRFSIMWEAIAF